MKIDPILQKQLEWRFKKENRKLVFITRTKMFIQLEGSQWQQNCSGLLVFCQKEAGNNFTVINITSFEINFDFQLYSNFTNYCKFLGDQKCLIFLAPIHSKTLKIMFVLESKTQLTDLKRVLDKLYNISDSQSNQLDFLSRPDVLQILKKAQVDQNILANDLTFREQVETQMKNYLSELENKNKNNIKKTGFKSYALGRQQWKLQTQEINFLKEKLFIALTDNLNGFQKQAKIRMNKR